MLSVRAITAAVLGASMVAAAPGYNYGHQNYDKEHTTSTSSYYPHTSSSSYYLTSTWTTYYKGEDKYSTHKPVEKKYETTSSYYPSSTYESVSYTPEATYTPHAKCQTQLLNTDFGFSFSPVPIWKEPWVVGTCIGAGDCEFTGVEPFEESPLKFNEGGFMANKGATAQVGQSFTLCPRKYDYKVKFRSAVLGDWKGDENEVTFIASVGGELTRIDPIKLTKNKFGYVEIELPGSKKGGEGFVFFTGKTGEKNYLLVDHMSLI